jgi:hypothetical protein
MREYRNKSTECYYMCKPKVKLMNKMLYNVCGVTPIPDRFFEIREMGKRWYGATR